jgi:hypothetical protein
MRSELNIGTFALSEQEEEQIDNILAASMREPICIRIKLLMEFRGWNARIFTDCTGLEGYMFTRIRKNKIEQPTLGTVIAICVAQRLNYPQTIDLLVSGGMVFGNNPTHRAYRRLILEMHGRTVQECNEYLAAQGIPPLGSTGRDEKVTN